MKKLLLSLTFMLFFGLVVSSCSSEDDVLQKENNELPSITRKNNAKAHEVGMRLLESFGMTKTRSLSVSDYPDYYGGSYINEDGKLVVFLKGEIENTKATLIKLIGDKDVTYIKGNYSYTELNNALTKITLFIESNKDSQTAKNIKYYYLNNFENNVVVELNKANEMGIPRQDSFPRTTELMQGVDYLVRQALAMGRPMVINLSFGNNYGSHRGDSLLETYLDSVSSMGKLAICVGMGNNGSDALHCGGKLSAGEIQEIELGVGPFEPNLNIQLWKDYEDEMEIYLENPSGERVGPLKEALGAQRWSLGNTELLIYYGKPAPYHVTQEIYVDFLVKDEADPLRIQQSSYIDSGVWKIILVAGNIKNGEYFLWLPGGKTLNPGTAFYLPRAQGTLTIPATARRVISVGAYDARLNAYADFSGRGSCNLPYPKPDLTAPGVDILAPRAGGGYARFSGTSFSTPFVTGAAALLMEWGIIRGNDPYLYGEKLKAYLRRGARPLPGIERYPDDMVGWGALCTAQSLPEI